MFFRARQFYFYNTWMLENPISFRWILALIANAITNLTHLCALSHLDVIMATRTTAIELR